MDNYLDRYRMAMIEDFQNSLKTIRLRMECSMVRFAECIGVTRQTINNLESGRIKMSPAQFLSLAAVVDNYISTGGRNAFWVEDTVNGGFYSELEHHSVLRRWFSCFENSRETLLENSLCRARGEYVTAMRQMVDRYTIMLDYGVFFNREADTFLSSLADILSAAGKTAIVPNQEVRRLEQLKQDPDYRETADKALALIERYQKDEYQQDGVLVLREDVRIDIPWAEMALPASGKQGRGLCLIIQEAQQREKMLHIDPPGAMKDMDLLVGFVNGGGRARVQRWTPRRSNVITVDSDDLPENTFDAPPPQQYTRQYMSELDEKVKV